MTNAFSRRQFLLGGLVLAGTGAVAACTSAPGPAASAPGPSLRPTPTPTALGEPTVRRTLTARPLSLDIGGIEAKTWGYVSDTGDAAIEATAGDVLQVDITNELPESTSIHWHGIALHNAADGVPGMTQDPLNLASLSPMFLKSPTVAPTSTIPTPACSLIVASTPH